VNTSPALGNLVSSSSAVYISADVITNVSRFSPAKHKLVE